MDKFKTILNINKPVNVSFTLVVLLTVGGEHIFSAVVFKCPCNHLNLFYGLVFLLVPALALTTLGFILSKKTWKLVTGLCERTDKGCCHSCNRVKSLGNVLFQISTVAFLAPSTWIAVGLLNGVFIECAMTGTNMILLNNHLCEGRKEEKKCLEELHVFPCGKGEVPEDVRNQVLLTLRAESQILGWLLIATIFLSYLVITCLARCSSPVSYLQLKFWRRYMEEESAALDSYMTKHARKLADRNVKSFFTSSEPEFVHTPSNKEWQAASSIYMYRSKTGEQHYSPLHGFVECQTEFQSDDLIRTMSGTSSNSGRITPAALAFVDER